MGQLPTREWKAKISRLPEATSDLEQVKRDFTEFGYGMVKDSLDLSQVAAIKDRLVQQGQAELAVGAKPEPAFQRVLPNKGQVFRELILQPKVFEMMTHGFGELEFCLSNITGMITRKGVPPQAIHCDQSYLPDPPPRAWVNNAIYMISEFTEENGATRVIPGSHRWPPPRMQYFEDGRYQGFEDMETTAIEGEAGTALVFDGRLWHGAGACRCPARALRCRATARRCLRSADARAARHARVQARPDAELHRAYAQRGTDQHRYPGALLPGDGSVRRDRLGQPEPSGGRSR